MEYASNGKANAALTTGIIGSVLGGVASVGGIGAILGVGRNQNPANMQPGDRPVTRYEMELIQANNAKDNEITLLKAQQYTDRAMVGVQAQFAQQIAINAVQGNNIQALQNQLAGITKIVVPNDSVMPGWGNVNVVPVPLPVPPVPPAASSSASTTTTTSNNG